MLWRMPAVSALAVPFLIGRRPSRPHSSNNIDRANVRGPTSRRSRIPWWPCLHGGGYAPLSHLTPPPASFSHLLLDEKILLPTVPAIIKVISAQAGLVRLGIEAPAHVPILREELTRNDKHP